MFGAQGGLFGAPAVAAAPAAGGLFGAQPAAAPAAGGLFSAQPTAAPAAGGLFGAQPAAAAAAAPTGGLFGAPAATGGLFSAQPAAAAAAPTGGLFGAAQPVTAAAAAPAGGLFGVAQPTAVAPAAGGLFSAPTVQAGGSLFGGQQPQQPAIGGGLFGAQPAAGGGLFGAQPAAVAGGGGLFGGQQQQQQAAIGGGLFGTPAAAGGGLFGVQQQPTQLPAAGAGGLFGAPVTPLAPTTGGFGATYNQKPINNSNNTDQKANMGFTDCISSLSFNAQNKGLLAGSSWDKSIRVFNMNGMNTMSTTVAAPVLSCAWLSSGTAVAAGCCDNVVRIWDVNSNKTMDIGKHSQSVSRVLPYMKNPSVLFSTSWDGTLLTWDLRTPNGAPVGTTNMGVKIVAADIQGDVLAVVTGDGKYHIFAVNNTTRPAITNPSGLNSIPRTCALTFDQTCLAISSAEGRCTVKFFRQPAGEKDKSFTFKCHRNNQDVFCTNDVSFHPFYNSTLSTVGSDGLYFFWDKDNRQRLHTSKTVGQPITCSKFSIDGGFFAYAASYDWSLGSMPAGSYSHDVYIHRLSEQEVVPKKK